MRAALGFFLAFAILTASVHAGLWHDVDRGVVGPLATGSPCAVLRVGYAISPWLSAQYTVPLAALLTLGLAWRTRRGSVRRASAFWLLAGLLATAPVELVSKYVVEQPPPRTAMNLDRPECGAEGYGLTTVTLPHSYPSGSVARLAYFSTLGYVALGALKWRRLTRSVLVVVVLLAAATRMPIGWHWASDVLGGLLFGAGVACLAAALLRRHTQGVPGTRRAPWRAGDRWPVVSSE